jgi:hypothetical protein
MIHCLTSSYARDFERAAYLNERVVNSGAVHHIFFDPTHPVHLERSASIPPTDVRFCHLSGMSICAGWRVFNKSIPPDEAAMLSIIDFMLNEGFTPSEDVMLSYLLQRDEVKLRNLFDKYDRTFNAKGDIWVTKKTQAFGQTLFKES